MSLVPFLLSLPVSAFTFKQGQAHIYSLKKKKAKSGQSIAQVGGCNTQRLLCDEVAWTKKTTWVISCLSASRNALLAPIPSPQWSRIQDHENLWIMPWSQGLHCGHFHLKLKCGRLRIQFVFRLSHLLISFIVYHSPERWEESPFGNFAKRSLKWPFLKYSKYIPYANKVVF